jgi:hypothetical protein
MVGMGILMRKHDDINKLWLLFGGCDMNIHYMDKDATTMEKIVEIFWITILHIGYPFFTIFEYLHWEIYGKGPTKKPK